MRIDRSFEDFFSSIGTCVAVSTILVSTGKLLTPYYFYIMVIILTLVVALMVHIDRQRNRQQLLNQPHLPLAERRTEPTPPHFNFKKRIFRRKAFRREARTLSCNTQRQPSVVVQPSSPVEDHKKPRTSSLNSVRRVKSCFDRRLSLQDMWRKEVELLDDQRRGSEGDFVHQNITEESIIPEKERLASKIVRKISCKRRISRRVIGESLSTQ